jgi:hypothetical protein
MKREEISTKLEEERYECIVCKKVYSSRGIATHHWLNHGDGGDHKLTLAKNIKNAKRIAWNKGLTKDEHPSLARASETQKRKIASGEITFKGTPHTPEVRSKISKARSEFLSRRGNGGFSDVKWYRRKDSYGNECSLRGTWEVKVADWLDENNYLWTRHFSLFYNDGEIVRTYSPDFFVQDLNVVIEVKGYFSSKDKQKMLYVQEQNPNHKYVILAKKEIDNLQAVHEMLF